MGDGAEIAIALTEELERMYGRIEKLEKRVEDLLINNDLKG